MIQQRVGDVLEIQYEGKYYYVVVLTKVVLFGGNIVFAFHSNGGKRELAELLGTRKGFNVIVDLLLSKKEGSVTRLHRIEDSSTYWLTRLAKGGNEYRPGMKSTIWFIYDAMDIGGNHIARVTELNDEHRQAMDYSCFSFDLVAGMIERGCTPSDNVF